MKIRENSIAPKNENYTTPILRNILFLKMLILLKRKSIN